ncbi:MAG TPA: alpha/beta fold hydrolase, partial [Actinomycetota bacterium]|nr:alpha/beta fold hydrolase [Actinomycetota bacterium]
DAALGPVPRLAPNSSTLRFAARLARHPVATGQRLGGLAAELARVGAGTSTIAPSKGDRRFADPAWSQNPLLYRAVQGYLATSRAAGALVDDVGLDWRDDRRVRFLVENLVQALSPSNLPLLNPESAKAAIDTAGGSLARGSLSFLRDMAAPPRIPEMVDTSPFAVGRSVAVTPGAVVLRTEVLELIQYRPQTKRVREIPLLIAPPTINKYYALDLAPGRSLIEYLVRGGQQVFVISWRNPDARHAAWGLDTYVQSVLDAFDAVQRVCRTDRAALMGICAGGIIASIAAAHLASAGQQDRLAAFGLAVTVLDNARAGTAAALADRRLAAAATALSRRRGYLDGRSLAEVFAWLRPGDLVWNYWVNNYLLGRKPPAFDILFWNADTTRMPAQLHADFVDVAMDNPLVTPGAMTVLGVPVDLSRIEVDSYLVAGIADHLTPWQNCYRSTQLLGGERRFVLSTSGHIAALVNPPGNAKASYRVNKENPADPQQWLRTAHTEQGSWWPDALAWLGERCGADNAAPQKLGGAGMRPLMDAPGTYVLDT